MIGLQRRFDQNFMRVRQAVQKKEVGDPIMIKLCSRDPSPPPFSYVKVCIQFFCTCDHVYLNIVIFLTLLWIFFFGSGWWWYFHRYGRP
jgi:hypothetical protein